MCEYPRRVGQYWRISVHTLEEVFAMVGRGVISEQDHSYNTNSERLILFKEKGVTCVTCGVVGRFFAKEKSRGDKGTKYHFNLYAINSNGNYVLMTKDHIRPKSKGGSNSQSNYQPMCARCNTIKSNNWSEPRKEPLTEEDYMV